jgi:hypothetical protein
VDDNAEEFLNGAFIGFAEEQCREIKAVGLTTSREESLVSGEALQPRDGERMVTESVYV